MKFNDILRKVQSINPYLDAEYSDALNWRNICMQRLADSYNAYMESEERLKKITKKLEDLRR